MSQRNVDLVRRAFEAQRHDNETVFALYDPEIEIEDDPVVEGPSRYRGLDGVQEFLRNRLAVFSLSDVEVEEWIDAGDEVIAVLHFRTHGRHSGVPVDIRQAHMWTVKDGRLTRLCIYQSKAEALERMRLPESPSASDQADVLDHRDE